MGTSPLSGHFRQLDVVAEHLGWCPSSFFRGRLTRFARSVGPGNVEDLFALASLLAYEHLQPILTAGSRVEESQRVRAYLDAHQVEFERDIIRGLDRERKRWNRAARPAVPPFGGRQNLPADDDTAGIAEEARLWRRIEDALSPKEQHLLDLHFAYKLSFKQIAKFPEFEGLSEAAIRTRWSRLAKKLRTLPPLAAWDG